MELHKKVSSARYKDSLSLLEIEQLAADSQVIQLLKVCRTRLQKAAEKVSRAQHFNPEPRSDYAERYVGMYKEKFYDEKNMFCYIIDNCVLNTITVDNLYCILLNRIIGDTADRLDRKYYKHISDMFDKTNYALLNNWTTEELRHALAQRLIGGK